MTSSPSGSSRRLARVASAFAAILVVAPSAGVAATFTVGPGVDCTHTDLQAAVNAAAGNSSNDLIRIVDATFTGVQISTNTNQSLEIVGGWASCNAASPIGKTNLDGTGGQARSVIALRGNGNFTLRNLAISGGDQAGDDDGGGIHFQGGGILRIDNTEITGNSADEGGGIYAHGTTTTAELILGANVLVSNNTARQHGGGVVAQSIEMSMLEPGSALFLNTAGGYGGGLFVRSGDFSSHAYIGTSGFGGLGAVYGNRAAVGGGISVFGGEDTGRMARVQLFSTTVNVPLRIVANEATQRGGAIDLQPDGDTDIINYEFSVAHAVAELQYVELVENSAPSGAAIFSSENTYDAGRRTVGGTVRFNAQIPQSHPAAVACPFGAPCGSIRANRTNNGTGAIIQLLERSLFRASRITLEDNEGGWLIYVDGERAGELAIDNSLVSGNVLQHALIRDDRNGESNDPNPVRLHFLTVVDNLLGANGVLSINEDMDLTRSIIDQPGKQLIATDVGTIGGTYTMEQNVVSVTPLPAGAVYGPPRFVDAARGDYTPRAGSRAVDFATALPGMSADLLGHTRNLDLIGNTNETGVADVGAIEREYLDPLVLNAEFDSDVRHWNIAPGNWDATQDRDGDAGSGSAKAIYEPGIGGGKGATPVAANAQCIHLPGPGVYELNGHARLSSGAPGNRARIQWELREFGGLFGCEDGAPDLTGIHVLATGTTWNRPANPSQIVVASADWSVNTSLTLRLDVLGAPIGTTIGWFDGIELIKTDDPPSSNANAANIITTAGPLVPAFSADTFDYAVDTQNDSASVRVDAQVQSASITINTIPATSGVASAPFALAPGANLFTIRITAPDGVSMNTYFLTVTRGGGPDSLFSDGFEG